MFVARCRLHLTLHGCTLHRSVKSVQATCPPSTSVLAAHCTSMTTRRMMTKRARGTVRDAAGSAPCSLSATPKQAERGCSDAPRATCAGVQNACVHSKLEMFGEHSSTTHLHTFILQRRNHFASPRQTLARSAMCPMRGCQPCASLQAECGRIDRDCADPEILASSGRAD